MWYDKPTQRERMEQNRIVHGPFVSWGRSWCNHCGKVTETYGQYYTLRRFCQVCHCLKQ